jgi:hypothetical protein
MIHLWRALKRSEQARYLLYFLHILNFDFLNELARCALAHPVWLLENKFPYNSKTFAYVAKMEDNMYWLLENKFPYNLIIFNYVAEIGIVDNMK